VKTTYTRKEDVEKRWYVFDAAGVVLGRLASQLAIMLRGKHKPSFTPHVNCGDCIIVLNAAGIRLTGNKLNTKTLKRYTGYPGGLKLIPYTKLMKENPARVLRRAVWGMLPHNVLGRRQIRALKIFAGPAHTHAPQMPTILKMANGRLVAGGKE